MIFKAHQQGAAKLFAAVALLGLSLAYASGSLAADREQAESLRKSGLPLNLAEHLDRLKSLHINHRIKDLQWLRSKNLVELEITEQIDSLAGINRAAGLKRLTLNLINSPVNTLSDLSSLKCLDELTLLLGSQPQTDLSSFAPPQLHTLNLTLAENDIPNFSQLSALTTLQNLSVTIRGAPSVRPPAFKLQGFNMVHQISTLKLDLEDSAIQELPDFSDFKNLTTLTVDLKDTSKIETLANLKLPKVLTNLTLNLDSSQITKLPDFDNLTGLTSLSLTLNDYTRLPANFKKLTALKFLTLDLRGTGVQQLPEFEKFTKLKSLSLALNHFVEIDTISVAPKATALKDLRRDRQLSLLNISPLAALKCLKSLDIDLRNTKVKNLDGLSKIRSLETLTVHLYRADAHLLPNLLDLRLSKFAVYLEAPVPSTALLKQYDESPYASAVEQAKQVARIMRLTKASILLLNLPAIQFEKFPNIPTDHIRDLTLNVADSNLANLDSLSRQKRLRRLIIDLEGTLGIKKLPDLAGLNALQCISLNLPRTAIEDLSGLPKIDSLRSLFLNLQGAEQVAKLPSFSGLESGTLILQNSAIGDLQQIQGWDFLDTLTIDEKRFAALTALPHRVTNLNFMVHEPLKGCQADQ